MSNRRKRYNVFVVRLVRTSAGRLVPERIVVSLNLKLRGFALVQFSSRLSNSRIMRLSSSHIMRLSYLRVPALVARGRSARLRAAVGLGLRITAGPCAIRVSGPTTIASLIAFIDYSPAVAMRAGLKPLNQQNGTPTRQHSSANPGLGRVRYGNGVGSSSTAVQRRTIGSLEAYTESIWLSSKVRI